MVVDTVEQGQACLDYLRKQNVGRASLMILDKLNRSSGMEHMQTPENVPRLFDLIKPKEPRFAAAFYKGCGNTVVAADLDQANRIAFGSRVRWRVVTLAGQLIDSSGTMSGGGNYVSRGGMSAKLAPDAVGPDVLRQYEQDSEAAARELDEATRELRKAQEEHDALLRSVPQLDMSIKKANMDVQNGTKRIAEAERRVRELNAQSKPDSGDVARISTLEREIALAKSDLAKLQEKTSAIEAELKGLEKKILEIGGAKLLKQRSTVEGLKLHIEIATNEITKAEVAKDKAERDSVKLSNAMKTHTAGLEESEAELTQLNQQKEEVSSTLSELRSRVEEAQAAAENSKDDLETLKADLDEKTEGIQEFKKKEMELMQKLQDIRQESQRNSEKLEHWQQEHEQLTLEEVSDEEDDDDEEEEGVKPEPTTDGEGDQGTPGPSRVKHEPGQPSAGKKKPRQTSANQLKMYSTAELARFKVRQLIADQELADEKVQATKADLGVLKEYKRREEEWQERAKHLEDVTAQRDTEKAKHDGLRKQRLDEFMAGFNLISLKLKEMYQMITLGGNAELELVDSMDPFSEGIIFSVMPPKKSWRNIANLSGGEKVQPYGISCGGAALTCVVDPQFVGVGLRSTCFQGIFITLRLASLLTRRPADAAVLHGRD
ncbi:hypothetical protein FA95DRAFT_740223 [Auriscalpium vulgare]|uniref:Uncharacterized protein n=1 Tax=Auriscalpium vulgare TaxID=40419 RepID=A0ACB8SB13_9AGAM|nr:hypothetical protein FA95DRAFT_740223 [Auriscalpium vulgare]